MPADLGNVDSHFAVYSVSRVDTKVENLSPHTLIQKIPTNMNLPGVKTHRDQFRALRENLKRERVGPQPLLLGSE